MTNKQKSWKCTVCGEVTNGDFPPEECSVCGVGSEKFVEINKDDDSYHNDNKERFIIVGGGPAGTIAADEIRKRNKTAYIEIISREDVIGYNRPMLTKGIMSSINMNRFFIRDYSWYLENKIHITLNKEVVSIDAKAKTVELDDGVVKKYDKLILTTGAESSIPPLKGLEKKGVFVLRSLKDVEDVKDYIKECGKKAAVIGAGVLGLEAASEMNKMGLDVTIIQRSKVLMGKQLDAEGALMLKKAILGKGAKTRTGVEIIGIQGDEEATGVLLGEGEVIPADIVIISAGVRENADLAEKAGAETNKGIVVNEKMETGLDDVFAAGDCARFKGMNYAIWPQAINMAKIAARNAVGEEAIYKGTIPSVSFVGFGTSVFSVGDHGNQEGVSYETKEYIDEEKGVYRKYYFIDGKFCGGILLGDTSKITDLLRAYGEKRSIDEMDEKA